MADTAPALEPFRDVKTVDVDPLIDRVAHAKVLLLGEMTHGTSEFYRLRARITEALADRGACQVVALEADWPDAARVDQYVRHRDAPRSEWTAFARWPTWMWRNQEFHDLVEHLRATNLQRAPEDRVGVCGLDLYSLGTSITEVIRYLEERDPEAAEVARQRYACLARWEEDPAQYGAAVMERLADCEDQAVAMLQDLLARRLELVEVDGASLFDAQQNARVIRGAERYYRSLYQGRVSSWNLRDGHMVDTLAQVLDHSGPDARAVVWAHNSHVGDARGSEATRQAETTLGTLCRERWPGATYNVGQFTDHGTVVAGADWDAPAETMDVVPSHPRSHGAFLRSLGADAFLLPLDAESDRRVAEPRIERAIGVVYRPRTERQSHYFGSVLSERYDEVVWIRETQAVHPLATGTLDKPPETYPFGV